MCKVKVYIKVLCDHRVGNVTSPQGGQEGCWVEWAPLVLLANHQFPILLMTLLQFSLRKILVWIGYQSHLQFVFLAHVMCPTQ